MFLKSLLDEAEAIQLDGQDGPKVALEEDDKVVGVLSNDLKRLLLLREGYRKKVDTFNKKVYARLAEVGDDLRKIAPEENREHEQKKELLSNEIELVDAIFWSAVKHEFPAVIGHNIAVRQGWQVVTFEDISCGGALLGCLLAEAMLGGIAGRRG
jgi:hypothetical protein